MIKESQSEGKQKKRKSAKLDCLVSSKFDLFILIGNSEKEGSRVDPWEIRTSNLKAFLSLPDKVM